MHTNLKVALALQAARVVCYEDFKGCCLRAVQHMDLLPNALLQRTRTAQLQHGGTFELRPRWTTLRDGLQRPALAQDQIDQIRWMQ